MDKILFLNNEETLGVVADRIEAIGVVPAHASTGARTLLYDLNVYCTGGGFYNFGSALTKDDADLRLGLLLLKLDKFVETGRED